ncbi:GNAT family N-acetyltransferase [Labrys sp. KB_33_2]|uniref:GNAT family N-acetyltransferase n=1 Tax=Labrys sp. KB_33_2 TaxID=3237479 RepID=UPI003F8FCD6F
MMMKLSVQVHDSLETVSKEWPVSPADAPANARYHVFQTLTFLRVWWDTFGRGAAVTPCLVEVRDAEGRPVLFAPLGLSKRKQARILTFADADAADYNAPILFPVDHEWTRERAAELWRLIVEALPAFDLVTLSKMPEQVGGLTNPLYLIADASNDVACHGTNLCRPWHEIDKAVPFRKTLLKKMRGLERIGPLRYLVVADEQDHDGVLAFVLRQKQRRFEETKVPGFDADPEKYAFFHEGTRSFVDARMVHLAGLRVGDEIVGAMWGLVQGRHYYAILIGSEGTEWAKYSIGRIVYYKTLEWLHKAGFEYMDLGIGDEPWKLDHCDTTVPLAQMTVIRTWRGRWYRRRMRALESLRQTLLWRKLRPLKWVVLRWLGQSFVGNTQGRRRG